MKLDVIVAKRAITLLRSIFEFISPTSFLKQEWMSYRLNRKKPYSHDHELRSRLLNQPLTYGESAKILAVCEENSTRDSRYLAAMTMILCGISIEEACALKANSMATVAGSRVLKINHIVRPQGTRNTRANHERIQRHTLYQLSAKPDLRYLGVSEYLYAQWVRWKRSNKGFDPNALILCNQNNKDRVLHPKEFRRWMSKTFSLYITEMSIMKGGETMKTTKTIDRRFIDTAHF